MTIPIQPGPFEFLKSAGQALGAVGVERERKRRTALEEAQEKARNMIALRAAGLMQPKQFESPEVQEIFRMAGFGPVSSEQTSGEMLEYGKRDFLPTILGGANADEQRALFGAPQRGLTEQIDANIAGSQAAIPKARLEGASAEAALPEAGATVIAGQQGTQDQLYNGIADRVVETLYAQTNKLPSPDQAFTFGLGDERAKAHGERINKQYYGSAIERLRARLAAETTSRLNATSRAAGAAGTGLDDLLKIYQNNQTRITAELNALDKPSDMDQVQARAAAAARSAGRRVSPIFAGAEAKVKEYEKKRADLEAELKATRKQLNSVLGPAAGIPGDKPNPIRPLTSGQIGNVVKRMREQKIAPSQIDLDVRNGLISEEDGERIKAQLNAKGAGGSF